MTALLALGKSVSLTFHFCVEKAYKYFICRTKWKAYQFHCGEQTLFTENSSSSPVAKHIIKVPFYLWIVAKWWWWCLSPEVAERIKRVCEVLWRSPLCFSGYSCSLWHLVHRAEAIVLQEGGPLPGPETGLLSNTRKWIVWGDTYRQSKRFYWERAPGWRAMGKGTQENCSAAWLTVSGFMVMGLVSGWSLANHSNSEPFPVAHASLSQDGC